MNLKQILINLNIVFIIGLVCIYFYKSGSIQTNPIVVSGPYLVRSVQVIQGNEFDITYDTGRVHGKLIVSTPPEAKVAVTRLLNEITNPKVYLIKQEQDFWYIRMIVLKDGKEVDLVDWLKSQNLVWQNNLLLAG